MSRTDKDMPYWVTAEWYEPFHQCGWIRRRVFDVDPKTGRFVAGKIEWQYRGDCDLPENPVRRGGRYWWLTVGTTRCVWEAEWPISYYSQARGRSKKQYRRFEFNGPQRSAERQAARKIIKGSRDTEFPDGRTRHSVHWEMS